MSDILSDILTKSQAHEENDDHVHEDVKANTTIANNGVVTNHDHAFEDAKTQGRGEV